MILGVGLGDLKKPALKGSSITPPSR